MALAFAYHSIYGRDVGVTRGSPGGTGGRYLTGDIAGTKFPNVYWGVNGSELAQFGANALQTLTSGTTATQITGAGVTTIATSSALTWTLAPPVASALKVIQANTTGTPVAVTVRLSTSLGGNFQSTAGSSFQALTLNSNGEAVTLMGLSTSIWQVLTNTSSAAMTT